ncbi:MAG: tetratricopeptide repeat protein, partial [Gammaproteobacteria bacterium]|nr:tetratricopeptide repeat protein [Gammaproteobacteria bacterium]
LTFAKLAAGIDDIETLKNKIDADSNNYDAQFDLAIHLITLYQYNEAADTLLNIQRENPEYKDGAAKELLATISNMLAPTDNELAKEIRRKLANLISN